MKFTPFEPVPMPDEQSFQELFFNQDKPLFIKGGAKNWPAISRWTNEYLSEKLKEKTVSLAHSKSNIFNFNKDLAEPLQQTEVSMAEAIQKVCAPKVEGHHYYILKQAIKEQLPELLDDISLPSFMEQSRDYRAYLWFGQKSNQAQLHFDLPNNVFVQVRGRKLIRLCSPEQSELLYPTKASMSSVSRVLDLDKADLNEFPRFAEAEFLEFTLEPGDIMFIPTGWWHQVNSLDMAISVSFWWQAKMRQCMAPHVLEGAPYLYKEDGFSHIDQVIDMSEFSGDLRKAAKRVFDLQKPWLGVLFCNAYINKFNLKHLVSKKWADQVNLSTEASSNVDESYGLEMLETIENQ